MPAEWPLARNRAPLALAARAPFHPLTLPLTERLGPADTGFENSGEFGGISWGKWGLAGA